MLPQKQRRFAWLSQKKAPSDDKDSLCAAAYGLVLVKRVDGLLIFYMIAQRKSFVTQMAKLFQIYISRFSAQIIYLHYIKILIVYKYQ